MSLWTVRSIAESAGVPMHCIRYAIRHSNQKLTPQIIGTTKVYSDADARKIIAEEKRIRELGFSHRMLPAGE